MSYAIVQTGGKQYRIEKGEILDVEKVGKKDDSVLFERVLLYVDGDSVKIGKPTLADVVIKARVIDNIKGEKIRVSKFKAKAKYRRTTGFRKIMSKIEIEDIVLSVKKEKAKVLKSK